MHRHISFWLGVFITLIVAIPLIMFSISNAEDLSVRYSGFLSGVGFCIIVALIAVLFFRDSILKQITGSTKAKFTDFSDNFVKLMINDVDRQQKIEAVNDITKSFINWYTWTRLYKWVIATCIAILLATVGFAGAVLVAKQNTIMNLQKDQADLQNGLQIFETQSFIRSQLDILPVPVTKTTLLQDYELELEVSYPQCAITGSITFKGLDFESVANSSTLLTVKNLSERESTKVITREVLNNLLEDNDSGVAMSSLLILDELAPTEKLDGNFYGENLSGNYFLEKYSGNISLVNSAVGVECQHCYKTSYSKSFIFPSETRVDGDNNLYMFQPNFGAGYLVDWGAFENLRSTLVLFPDTQNLANLVTAAKEHHEDFAGDTNWYGVLSDWRNVIQIQHMESSQSPDKCNSFKELCFLNPFLSCDE